MGDDQFEPDQTEARLQKLLQGAFDGPPTPLKEIPKKKAPRAKASEEPQRKARRQRKNRAA